MKTIIYFLFFIAYCVSSIYAQECPRILRSGDELYTDPANAYQWFKNGEAIPGETNQYFTPDEKADYSVWVEVNSPIFGFTINKITVKGEVFDEYLQPVVDAVCSCQGQITKTNAEGKFTFELNANNRIPIQCKKENYITSTYAFKPTGLVTQHVKLKMEAREITEIINAKEGGYVRHQFGMVHLKPNSIADENGNLYNGEVHVHFKHYSPDDEWFGLSMPGGDFMALDENNEEVILYSYGFFQAELTTPTGETLNIADGQTARLYSVIAQEQQATAPDSIPIWYFDENNSYWIQEGWGYRDLNTYECEVSHFSSWNCDWAGPRATVTGIVRGGCTNVPTEGIPVHLGGMTIYTDENGQFSSWCPANLSIYIKINAQIITVPPINAGEVYVISDTLSANDIVTYSVIDENYNMIIHTKGGYKPLQYSIDGINYQTENTFIVNPKFIPCVWIKDSCGLISKSCKKYFSDDGCVLLDSIELSLETRYFYYDSLKIAAQTGEDIYLFQSWSLGVNLIELYLLAPCLQELSLSFFPLEHVELIPEIGLFTNLQSFFIYNVHLKDLPIEFYNLKKLENLALKACNIISLPSEIGQLKKLKYLYLDENVITSVSSGISELTNLIELNLNSNFLTTLPYEISNLKDNLKILRLEENKFSQEEKDKIESWLPNTTIYW